MNAPIYQTPLRGLAPSDETVQACRKVMARHARSFRWAAAFLSESQADDVAVAYTFCRAVDDAVDEAASASEATAALGLQEDMLFGRLLANETTLAYQEISKRLGFGLEPARELMKGARSDLGVVLVKDDAELLTYCFRVAGTVGVMMCGILGVKDEKARRQAIDLGIAMQLTNICRDVLEDADRGRVYLPRSRLQAVGLRQEDLIHFSELLPKSKVESRRIHTIRRHVATVVRDLLEIADQKYESARQGYLALPVRARLSVVVAAELYQSIGHRLRDVQHADALAGRIVVPWHRKVLITVRASFSWLGASIVRSPFRNLARPFLQKFS